MTDEELLQQNAADLNTKRGAKLDRDKKSAARQARGCMGYFAFSVIFFMSLRVSEQTMSEECDKKGSCDCLYLFDASYSLYVLLMLIFSGFKFRLGFIG